MVVLVRGKSTYIPTYSGYDSNWTNYSPIIIGQIHDVSGLIRTPTHMQVMFSFFTHVHQKKNEGWLNPP